MLYNQDLPALAEEDQALYEIVLHSAELGPPCGEYQPLRVLTSRGNVEGRLYGISRPRCAALLLGGSSAGWRGPALGLYPRLGRELRRHSIAVLHLRYRHPDCLEECVLDALAGIGYLQSEGLHSVGLVGHDLGGAVALQAASVSAATRSLVMLAMQPANLDPTELPVNCPLLLIHGLNDDHAGVDGSEDIYEAAPQRTKQMILFPGVGHQLDEVADEVHDLVMDWLTDQLRGCSD